MAGRHFSGSPFLFSIATMKNRILHVGMAPHNSRQASAALLPHECGKQRIMVRRIYRPALYVNGFHFPAVKDIVYFEVETVVVICNGRAEGTIKVSIVQVVASHRSVTIRSGRVVKVSTHYHVLAA